MWSLVLASVEVGLATAVSWLLALLLPSLVSHENLLSTLSMAYLGYLQWLSAFLWWFISFWRSSGLLHTVLALWVRVLITLYLADKWWWLSHWKYWLVWLSFLYTVRDNVWSGSGLAMVSKAGMAPFLLVLHCKPYGWVDTINVFQKVVFIFFLLKGKCVIYIPKP